MLNNVGQQAKVKITRYNNAGVGVGDMVRVGALLTWGGLSRTLPAPLSISVPSNLFTCK